MIPFTFVGSLPGSKSLLNRAQIIASYAPDFKILGDSVCEDVTVMRRGLTELMHESNQPIDCAQAGTTFRFLALRASRRPGVHRLTGHAQLLARPQQELLPILAQLGVDATLDTEGLSIRSQGWRLVGDALHVHAERSSQFASAVVLNAWGLRFPLSFHVSKQFVSEGYFRMTLEICRACGMQIEENKTPEGRTEFHIPALQQVRVNEYLCEPDVSSAFAVAALAAVGGQARIRHFPRKSLQPDAGFIGVLREMGFLVRQENSELAVSRAAEWNGVTVDIENSPDLFPVLAVLAAIAKTPSRIRGISHLKYKESSRLEKSRELVKGIGAEIKEVAAGNDSEVIIEPTKFTPRLTKPFVFDSAGDHRMVMAGQVLRQAGYPVNIEGLSAVDKSFPEFKQFLTQRPVGPEASL